MNTTQLKVSLPRGLSEDEAKLMLAIKLYEVGKISLGQAAKIAGFSNFFQRTNSDFPEIDSTCTNTELCLPLNKRSLFSLKRISPVTPQKFKGPSRQ